MPTRVSELQGEARSRRDRTRVAVISSLLALALVNAYSAERFPTTPFYPNGADCGSPCRGIGLTMDSQQRITVR